jgi:hypothetical protein
MARPRSLAAAIVACVLAASAARAQSVPPRDSARVAAGASRLLQLISDFQMANSPELSAAVNELLSDTSVHMRMAPKRVATTADRRVRRTSR